MNRLKNVLRKFRKSEKGQGMVEYGLILALVSVVAIGALGDVGDKINNAFDSVKSEVSVENDGNVLPGEGGGEDNVLPGEGGGEDGELIPDPEPEPEITEKGVKFLGEVPASEMFTGQEISSETGVTEGNIHHNNESWLKFDDNGTILLVAKKSYRYGTSWKHLHSKGVVNGTKKVSKDGQTYKVRLLTGDHRSASNPSYPTSEWNRLMYPIHINSESLDEFTGTLPHTLGTGGGRYTDKDLHLENKVTGGTSWSQDLGIGNANQGSAFGRGGHLATSGKGVQIGDLKVTGYTGDDWGWRPVLELVK